MTEKFTLVWIRRDLRLHENTALHAALQTSKNVLPVFIFDPEILNPLPSKSDPRVHFIHQNLEKIRQKLKSLGSDLLVEWGKPTEVWSKILNRLPVESVFYNRDYEPAAVERDRAVEKIFHNCGVSCQSFADQCIFEFDQILKDDRSPYLIFTPYCRRWRERLENSNLDEIQSEPLFPHFQKTEKFSFPPLSEIGFAPSEIEIPPAKIDDEILQNYEKNSSRLDRCGTSNLGIDLRFGTISVRQVVRAAMAAGAESFLNEIAWRDFFMMLIRHFPRGANANFRSEFDGVKWRQSEADFEVWKNGKTGFPIVDAGMAELAATGRMPNRVRMITASFLCKNLLLDWRLGEKYFAEKLLDYELASNVGNWQWVAGTGFSAAPYFRVFNPETQQQKFDPQQIYCQKWLGKNYAAPPIVDLKTSRERAISAFREGIKTAKTS